MQVFVCPAPDARPYGSCHVPYWTLQNFLLIRTVIDIINSHAQEFQSLLSYNEAFSRLWRIVAKHVEGFPPAMSPNVYPVVISRWVTVHLIERKISSRHFPHSQLHNRTETSYLTGNWHANWSSVDIQLSLQGRVAVPVGRPRCNSAPSVRMWIWRWIEDSTCIPGLESSRFERILIFRRSD